jgi:hypothetical protein
VALAAVAVDACNAQILVRFTATAAEGVSKKILRSIN